MHVGGIGVSTQNQSTGMRVIFALLCVAFLSLFVAMIKLCIDSVSVASGLFWAMGALLQGLVAMGLINHLAGRVER